MNKKKLLLLSRDPGGTNALIAILDELKKRYEVIIYAKDYAADIYRNHGIDYIELKTDSKIDITDTLDDIIEEYRPDGIITGQSNKEDNTEMLLWEAARKKGILSFTIVDSWCSYDQRFPLKKDNTRYQPDYIFVMDRKAQEEICRLGIAEDKVIITGQPYLQYLSAAYDTVTEEEIFAYRSRSALDRKIILYASDCIKEIYNGREEWGYDQFSIFRSIVKAINETCGDAGEYILIVRPHPKESISDWEKESKLTGSCIPVLIDNATDCKIVIQASELVIGMWTILLIEAALAGKSIASVQIGAKKKAPFVLEERGLIKTFISQEELDRFFRDFFRGGAQEKIEWMMPDNAIGNITEFINEKTGEQIK